MRFTKKQLNVDKQLKPTVIVLMTGKKKKFLMLLLQILRDIV